MIHFHTIRWKNILSTGNTFTELKLDKSPNTLVIGHNGAGKSTLLDALCFVLFGKPFRKINKPNILNSINQSDGVVEVEFTIGKKEYKIIRGIKPNIFEIYLDGVMVNQDAAMKDYQKILEQQILRLNYKTFTQVVILGSASFVPFMQLPSHQRREVIEDILDIKIFSVMNQLLKEKAQETKDAIAQIESQIGNAKSKVDSQTTLIKALSEAKTDSIKKIETKITENNTHIETTQVEVDNIITEIELLKSKITHKEKIQEDIDKAKTLKSKISTKIETCEHHSEFFSEHEVCPSCSQDIPEDHKSKILKDLESKLQENNSKIEDLTTVLQKLNVELGNINTIVSQITDKNIELSTKNSTITLLNKQNGSLEREIHSTQADTGNIDDEKLKLKQLKVVQDGLLTMMCVPE